MKEITVIGMGQATDTLTLEAIKAIDAAQTLIGAARFVDLYKDTQKRLYAVHLPDDIKNIIESDLAERFAVLVSGDTGFYSAAAGLALLPYNIRFIPGVSIVNAFFARLKMPWSDVSFISLHKHGADIVGRVRRNRYTFCLTGNNVTKIGHRLTHFGFGAIKTIVGENIGGKDERIYITTPADLIKGVYPSLTVLLFINENFDNAAPTGLSDDCFIRRLNIPMTKSEIRAVIMSKLCVKPDDICCDIGAGSGSVTAEMAYAAYNGRVYAIERNKKAVSLIKENCRKLRLGNAAVICAAAPRIIKKLPAPDAVFIGGGGAEIKNIIKAVLNKNKNARIVITAAAINTASAALSVLKGATITQINAARGEAVSGRMTLRANNPVFIISK